jgi:hypothetical protein
MGVCLAVLLGVPSGALGADRTNIMDPFVRDSSRVPDVGVTIRWDFRHTEGLLTREFKCLSHDTQVAALCPDRSSVIDVDELKVRRIEHLVTFDFDFAVWRWVQLRFRLPYIASDQTKLDFAKGVNRGNSTVNPLERPSLFSLPFDGAERGGVGDPTLAVRFAPLNWVRDDTKPTWTLGVDVTLPVAKIKQASNDAVGEGLWQIRLSSALSTRFVSWFEPYFEIAGQFNLPAPNSLFQDYGRGLTQTLIAPGHQLGLLFGVEFAPYEDREAERVLSFDLGGGLDFHFEGREYTSLFEALGTSPCDPRGGTGEPCELTTYTRGDLVDPAAGDRRKTDGITDYEQYTVVTGWFGLRWQIVKWVVLRAQFNLSHTTSHFITTADAGIDLNNDGKVTKGTNDETNEYNPVYSEYFDSLGNRFRTANMMTYGAVLSLQGKF